MEISLFERGESFEFTRGLGFGELYYYNNMAELLRQTEVKAIEAKKNK